MLGFYKVTFTSFVSEESEIVIGTLKSVENFASSELWAYGYKDYDIEIIGYNSITLQENTKVRTVGI